MPGPYYPDPAADALRDPTFSEVSSQDSTGNVLERLAYMINNPSAAPMPPIINTMSLQSIGMDILSAASAAPANAVWPTANKAIGVPFVVTKPVTAVKMAYRGAAASGNIDLGIYDSSFARLVSTGSVAGTGTDPKEQDIVDTLLAAGQYYMVMAVDNTTQQVYRTAMGGALQPTKLAGCFMMLAAFPLPATITPAVMADAYVPIIAVAFRTLVQ